MSGGKIGCDRLRRRYLHRFWWLMRLNWLTWAARFVGRSPRQFALGTGLCLLLLLSAGCASYRKP